VGSLGVLAGATMLRAWRRLWIPRARDMFVAGWWVAYLALPLLHYLVFAGRYHYITGADNFFSGNLVLQLVAWALGGLVSWGVTALRGVLAGTHARPDELAR
jgi:hypothetical protein